MKLVVVESPFAGDVEKNVAYLRACLRDCLLRGEAPFASHAIYTQPGVLDDSKPDDRKLGIQAGFEWSRYAHLVAVYGDLGITPGMQKGIDFYSLFGIPIEYRKLPHVRPSEVETLLTRWP